MKASTRMMMIGLLAVAPVLASARTEYAQCLAEQNQLRSLRGYGSGGFRPANRVSPIPYRSTYSLDGAVYFSAMTSYAYLSRTAFTSDGYADQLAMMVRACRQYKEKREAPKFRVVGMKSPSFDRAGNRAQDEDTQ